MRKAQLLFSMVLFVSQLTHAGPTLGYKLKYGTGIFLSVDKTEYAPQYATHKMDLTKVETNRQLEVFSGKDPNSDHGIGTKYELRVYRPDYPKDKKISRWIEIESGRMG